MAAAVNTATNNSVRRTTLLLLSVCAAVALNAIQCKTNQTCRGTDEGDLIADGVGRRLIPSPQLPGIAR